MEAISIENQQFTSISSKECKFDVREMTCVGTEMASVSTEIDRDTAAMTKNLTEMKSARTEITSVSAEMSYVRTEIDFVGTEITRVSAELNLAPEKIANISQFPLLWSSLIKERT